MGVAPLGKKVVGNLLRANRGVELSDEDGSAGDLKSADETGGAATVLSLPQARIEVAASTQDLVKGGASGSSSTRSIGRTPNWSATKPFGTESCNPGT